MTVFDKSSPSDPNYSTIRSDFISIEDKILELSEKSYYQIVGIYITMTICMAFAVSNYSIQ